MLEVLSNRCSSMIVPQGNSLLAMGFCLLTSRRRTPSTLQPFPYRTISLSRLYLPVALMGRIPPMPSNLSFLPTEQYYWHLIWLSPIVLVVQWLLPSAFIHVVLRFSGRRSDVDQILNIFGISALVVGAFILVWDWTWLAVGGIDQYLLGISHLLISLWGVVIEIIGLKRLLGVPVWLGAILSLLEIPIALPFGIMFTRSLL